MSGSSSSPQRRQRGAAAGWSQAVAVVAGLMLVAGGWWMSRERALTIVVVSMDTTRFDHLSAYGYDKETSPTLARLAAEGTIFTHARTSAPWTLPSHMSLFTGLPPDLHGVSIDFNILDDARPTLGTIFHDAGFATVGMYTAPYVHPRFGFGRGFDFYERCTQEPMIFDLTSRQIDEQQGLRELISHKEITSRRVVNNAARRLAYRKSDRNLYFLHFFDPHYDYRAPPEIKRKFVDPQYAGPITGEDLMQHPELLHPGMPEEDLRALLGNYDAEIRWVDNNLRTVIDAVEQQGLVGKVLVVVVADHGEEFFEDGRFGHRMNLRDEVLRVPMLFWGPGIVPAGQSLDADVALYDVLPTLMDYADIPASDEVYGRSLRPLIDGGSLPPRPCTSTLTFLSAHADEDGYYTRHDSLVYEGLKYVRRVRVPWSAADQTNLSNPPLLAGADIDVFDLRDDPGERHDLYEQDPDDPRCLAILKVVDDEERRQRAFDGTLLREGISRPDTEAFDPAADLLDTMRQLGYAAPVDKSEDAPGPSSRADESQPSSPDAAIMPAESGGR